jgi:cytochrome c oxidase subunit 3
MEIPYTISNRPDTGLWNAKIGIWLFLASEVMLFGGLFSAYIFLRNRLTAGMWPHGLLNVPVGTMNTAILIMSSVTVVLAWASLKMRKYQRVLVVHAGHHHLWRDFLDCETGLRMAAEVRSLWRLH